jgi:hypothetical protein
MITCYDSFHKKRFTNRLFIKRFIERIVYSSHYDFEYTDTKGSIRTTL